jgi:MoxR-like ATPase
MGEQMISDVDDARLFFFTAAQKSAKQNLEISLRQGIELAKVQALAEYEELERHARSGRVFAWGARPGRNGERNWEKLRPSDVALVYSDGRFLLSGRVYAKAHSAEIARSIWGEDAEGNTFDYMVFLDPVEEIDASLESVVGALGYEGKFVPQGLAIPGDSAQERIRDAYGSVEAFVDELRTTWPTAKAVWWVNQGLSFNRSRDGGYLWAPKLTKDGRTRPDWDALTRVQPGDLVLSYSDSAIRAVCTVREPAVDAPRPTPEDEQAWTNDGRQVVADYRLIEPLIQLEAIPFESRLKEGGPFDRNGSVKQGYFFPLSEEFVQTLAERFPELGLTASPVTPPRVDLGAVSSDFSEKLTESHLSFGAGHDRLVRSFVAAMATKPFVILTGLSGSGKTQLALSLGRWFGVSRLLVTPVRPDWTGAEALFGYEDALQVTVGGRRPWHVPEPLEFMLRAAKDPGHPYLLVLDEMNLAHVERYFADVLSGMESREDCLPNLERDDEGRWHVAISGPEKITVPRNLFVAGTVNVDETTYMFSPEVLDRANTFEFRVVTDNLLHSARRPVYVKAGEPALVRGFLAIATDDNWHLENPSPVADAVDTQLRALHRLLSDGGFEFGHRVFYEAMRFSSLLAKAGEANADVALDHIILQKVLPRMHGSRRRLEPSLHALGSFCVDLGYEAGALNKISKTFDPTAPPSGAPRLPVSFDKIQRMARTLHANQFASFTD